MVRYLNSDISHGFEHIILAILDHTYMKPCGISIDSSTHSTAELKAEGIGLIDWFKKVMFTNKRLSFHPVQSVN